MDTVRERVRLAFESLCNKLESLKGSAIATLIAVPVALCLLLAFFALGQRSEKIAALKASVRAKNEVAALKSQLTAEKTAVAYYIDLNKNLSTELAATERTIDKMRPTIVQRHYHVAKPAVAKAKAKRTTVTARNHRRR